MGILDSSGNSKWYTFGRGGTGGTGEGIEQVYLRVLVDNIRARSLYAKLGFKQEKIGINLVPRKDGSFVSDVLMSKNLKG